jgi:uncharacterized protein (DUF1501 family)
MFSAAGITPFALNGFSLRPFANSRMANILAGCEGIADRTLILIQLKGGNDGLNALIPIDQYDRYAQIRPTIRVPENALLDLDTTLPQNQQLGIHPSMTALKRLYEEGRATIIQGVGYNNMNRSHFKGTDLWLSGGDSSPDMFNLGSGWMGRSLQAFFPDVQGVPTANMPDPLGIQVGDPNPSLGFHTETEHKNVINLSGQDPAGFFSLIQTIGGLPIAHIPDTDHGTELAYIMSVEQSVSQYAQRITETFNKGTNAFNSYPDNAFAAQLKTIARLISGGSKTKIFLCALGGFDTHSGQAILNNPTLGPHATLLETLSQGVEAFLNDLDQLGLSERVMACTFSEFGREAAENGSNGTDHGNLAPILLFGQDVAPGVQGNNPNLYDLENNRLLKGLQFDYRQVFTTLLQDWLGASEHILQQTLFDGFSKMPLVAPVAVAPPECYLGGGTTSLWSAKRTEPGITLYPNPARDVVQIGWNTPDVFQGQLSLFSLSGHLVTATSVFVQGEGSVFYLDVGHLPAGNYVVRLENTESGRAEVAKLIVAR